MGIIPDIKKRLQRAITQGRKKEKQLLTLLRKRHLLWTAVGVGVLSLLLVLAPMVAYGVVQWTYRETAMFGVRVADYEVAGMTREQMRTLLNQAVTAYRDRWPVTYVYGSYLFAVPFETEAITYDIDASIEQALALGKSGSVIENAWEQLELFQKGRSLPFIVSVDEEWLVYEVASMAAEINEEVIPPSIALVETATGSAVIVHAGEAGQYVDEAAVAADLNESLSYLRKPLTDLPVVPVEIEVTDEELTETKKRGERLMGKSLTLVHEDETAPEEWVLTDEELVHFLSFNKAYSREQMEAYLEGVAGAIEREPQDARFTFNKETGRVEEFEAAKDGVGLDAATTSEKMVRALDMLEHMDSVEPVAVAVSRVEPEVSLDDVNDLGITDLLGRGVSTYYGSIPTRVHNVGLAAQRITGYLVKPGGVFSFNEAVGEISGATGYQAAYVIMNGRTELGDGGGVCQDSTTVFRAALDAGLPIVERRAHSYRVGYYEQNAKPGLDATVYAPTTDLKFENNTPGHLLVQAIANEASRTLTVEIYGTDDGREATISNHVVWDITPPPPDVYIDDPTLPVGTVKQVDWKAGGAKAKFDYTVERDREVIYEKTFYSTFKPWSAKFLRGTKEG